MDSNMHNRLAKLFEQSNGHSSHPLDEWLEWISNKHPELVNLMIDEVMTRKDLTNEDLPAAFVAAGSACIFTGSQLFFDVVTGTIYGKDPDHEPFETGVVLHNIEQIRERAHELVNQLFDQYTEEFKEERANSSPDDTDLSGEDLEDETITAVHKEVDEEFEWEEVDSELEDEDKGDEWKQGKKE